METLGDRLVTFYEKFISPSKKPVTKESRLLGVDEYSNALQKDNYSKLTPSRRRDIANESPLLMKGIKKKSLDSVRAWLEIQTVSGRGKPVDADTKAIDAFNKRTNYKKKFLDAVICAHVYGDGFLLISFSNDKGVSISAPPGKKSEPQGVSVLNPEEITKVKYLSKENKDRDIYHYVLSKNSIDSEVSFIHPDRIQHIVIDSLPYNKLGLSKIDLLRHTIQSKKNIDIATGNILAWFSHGMVDVKWDGMSPEEKKGMMKLAGTHPSVWVHDEDMEIDIKNPQAIDPKPFYDYVVLNLAAALVMPTHILTGVQTGRVTGSEIGYGDYYRDVHDMQELIYLPLIESLYRRIIEARGREWKYNIHWNTIYIDEKAEADIMKLRLEGIEKGIGCGIIDTEEGREMYNNGQIELESTKLPPKPSIPSPKPIDPTRPPEPSHPPAPSIKEKTQENAAMIQRWKDYKKKQIDDYEDSLE